MKYDFIYLLADRDWMAKNTQEKEQSFNVRIFYNSIFIFFQNFKGHVKNWDINECIIFEMWED